MCGGQYIQLYIYNSTVYSEFTTAMTTKILNAEHNTIQVLKRESTQQITTTITLNVQSCTHNYNVRHATIKLSNVHKRLTFYYTV